MVSADDRPEGAAMTDTDDRTPWQVDRDKAERTGKWPESWGPFHRHFASDAIHRDGGPECDQPGTPRRVYVFDPDALDAHEAAVASYAATRLVRELADKDAEISRLTAELDATRNESAEYVITAGLEAAMAADPNREDGAMLRETDGAKRAFAWKAAAKTWQQMP